MAVEPVGRLRAGMTHISRLCEAHTTAGKDLSVRRVWNVLHRET